MSSAKVPVEPAPPCAPLSALASLSPPLSSTPIFQPLYRGCRYRNSCAWSGWGAPGRQEKGLPTLGSPGLDCLESRDSPSQRGPRGSVTGGEGNATAVGPYLGRCADAPWSPVRPAAGAPALRATGGIRTAAPLLFAPVRWLSWFNPSRQLSTTEPLARSPPARWDGVTGCSPVRPDLDLL